MPASFSGVWRKQRSGNENSPFETVECRALVAVLLLTLALVLTTSLVPGNRPLAGARRLRGRDCPFSCRSQLDHSAHLVVADDQRLQRVGPSGNHITGRNVSDKFRSLRRIDNDVTRCLINRLILRPLGKFFSAD